MKNILIILFTIGLWGCEKKEEIQFIEGTYTGTFQRDVENMASEESNITLTLENGIFEGTSNKTNFPAICQGTYSVKNDTIIFENNCEFTADFDWSLIINDKYVLTKFGKNLKFHRNSPIHSSVWPYTDYFDLVLSEKE